MVTKTPGLPASPFEDNARQHIEAVEVGQTQDAKRTGKESQASVRAVFDRLSTHQAVSLRAS